jgi:hypothetical protein
LYMSARRRAGLPSTHHRPEGHWRRGGHQINERGEITFGVALSLLCKGVREERTSHVMLTV